MGLGDMMGKAAGAMGGEDMDLGAKMAEVGVAPASLKGMGLDNAKEMLAEKGMGLDVNAMIAKFTGGEG